MKGNKITTKNYFETIKWIGFENLPDPLKQSHMVIMDKTADGDNWIKYDNDASFKRLSDLVFKKLEEFIRSRNREELSGTGKDSPEVKRAKEDAKGYPEFDTEKLKMILRMENDAEQEDGELEWITIRKKAIEKELKKRGEFFDGAKPRK